MKIFKPNVLFSLITLLALGLVSCLEDRGYTDIINGRGNDKVIVSWYGSNGTPNNKTVALPAGEVISDYPVTVSVTSSQKLRKEFMINVAVDEEALDAVNATITNATNKFYMLPDSTFDLLANSVTIYADTTEAPFTVRFYQHKIDKSKNYMLPLKIQDQEGVIVPSNTGTLKLTFIGNPLAGAWLWDFTRYNNEAGTGSPSTTWTNESTVFAPIDATSIKVPTGYYVQPNYLITFQNNGGVLSDFKAVIAPDEIEDAFTVNGIRVTEGPTITVNADYTRITVKYKVLGGSGYRNLTDVFHK